MNQLLRKPTTYLGVSVIAVVILIVLGFVMLSGRVHASDESGRLMTIHDRGEDKLILTEAATIGAALAEAGITLDSKDAVEPAVDEKLVASEYQVNIYRARPVTIVDGPMRQKVVTPYQTPERIIKDAGITLYPEDATVLSRSDNIIADGAGLQLTIDRATVFSLNLYGATTQVRTQGATIGDMLKEKNVTLGANDRVSIPLSGTLTAGIEVKVWREGKQTITAEEVVNFDTEQIRDADRAPGYKEVKTAGVTGLKKVTYEIEIKDGVEVARNEIASLVTKPAVQQVEVIGAKVVLSVAYSADRAAIMTAAGVAAGDQDYAAYIINNENALWCAIRWQGTSGCAATYYEKFAGAETSNQVGYGLCQATPGSKMASAGADWRTNVVTQMKWCHGYAMDRYGSWKAAYEAKVRKGWW